MTKVVSSLRGSGIFHVASNFQRPVFSVKCPRILYVVVQIVRRNVNILSNDNTRDKRKRKKSEINWTRKSFFFLIFLRVRFQQSLRCAYQNFNIRVNCRPNFDLMTIVTRWWWWRCTVRTHTDDDAIGCGCGDWCRRRLRVGNTERVRKTASLTYYYCRLARPER